MASSVSIEIHPLVVLNVTDHITRARYQRQQDPHVRVIGALLGKQNGRVLEIVNTVEFSYKKVPDAEGGIQIDESFGLERLEAYKKLFPDLECQGWYSSILNSKSDEPLPTDMIVHKRMVRFTESPFYLILNPDSKVAKEQSKLPFFLYEQDSSNQQHFIKLDYSLATSDSERIAVDHVAKAIDPNAKNSVLSQNLQSSLNALKLLRKKVKFLIGVVKNSEEIRKNQHFMRKLKQICAQVPITDRDNFDKNIFQDYSDIASVNLLASVTKGFESINELLEDFKFYQGNDANGYEDDMMMMGSYMGRGFEEEFMGGRLHQHHGKPGRKFL